MPRPDFSEYVVHFTKSARPHGLAQSARACVVGLDDIAQMGGAERLIRMLQDGVIRATNMPWTHQPCVCFTECVWGSLLDHAQRYSRYGVGFHKRVLFEAGGGPAIYMRQDLFRAQLARGGWPDEIWRFITPFVPEYASQEHRRTNWAGRAACDYTYEREWRVPHDFRFQLSDVAFLTVASYNDEAAMPRADPAVRATRSFEIVPGDPRPSRPVHRKSRPQPPAARFDKARNLVRGSSLNWFRSTPGQSTSDETCALARPGRGLHR